MRQPVVVKMTGFLDLPFEIREQIYNHLLILPSHDSPANQNNPNNTNTSLSLLHPAILSTCHQIHLEALPILYSKNTFQCHPKLLTSFPRLHYTPPRSGPGAGPRKQLTATTCPGVGLIRRWYLHARLDCGPFWDAATVAAALTGAEALELEVWQTMFRGDCGTEVLRRFEGVRGLRRVRVWGSTTGAEGYVAWLEGVMRSPVGSEVGQYEPAEEDDEAGG